MGNISLTSSMRSNLLSLQEIARGQSVTQNRLATGLKVSTAIDNPSSFYTAQTLNNRANDLSALLDSMSQGVQTIKAASQALEAGLKFLEQAKAIANQAREKSQSTDGVKPNPPYTGPIAARVNTEFELINAINNTTATDGVIVIENDIILSKNVGLSLKGGQKLVGKDFVEGSGTSPKLTFDFDSTTQAIGIELAQDSELSNLKIDYTSINKTNSNEFHAIRNSGYKGIKLSNLDITVKSDNTSNIVMSGIYNRSNGEINLNGIININAPSNTSTYIYGIRGENTSAKMIQSIDGLLNITTSGSNGRGIHEGANNLSGTVNINTSGQHGYGISSGNNILSGSVNITTSASNGYGHGIYYGTNTLSSTAQLLINTRHNSADTIYNSKISYAQGTKFGINAAKDPTGTGFWQSKNNKTSTVSETFTTLNGNPDWDRLGDFPGISAPISFFIAGAPNTINTNVIKATSNQTLTGMTGSYNSILDIFNQLIKDSGYKGVNLLREENLKINFNEDRSSNLKVTGKDASTKGLGLSNADWSTTKDIEASISELETAINQVRNMSNEFGNYYSIVTNRENFTESIINVLTEGADKLTLADMNQESANMLALQTRQQLAVNALSLASQAAQSVLKLF